MSRTTDPFVLFRTYQDLIYQILGVLGVLILLFVLIRIPVRRMGGWKASWARLRRETALTAYAYTAPFRAFREYRRVLRVLVRGLRAPVTWQDAERAVMAARHAGRDAPAHRRPRPYAALVASGSVTVLVAGTGLTRPPDPWSADPGEPGRWTASRTDLPDVTPEAGDGPAVMVAVGEADGACAFLDLAAGPATTAVDGDSRTASALLRALAAQLDTRLPEGLVTVAEGVHHRHQGRAVRDAFRSAGQTPPRGGLTPVLVATELPDPLPADFAAAPAAAPPRLKVLVLGSGRGHVRKLLTDRYGRVLLTGTDVLADANPLGRAIARVLPDIPPVRPPQPVAVTAGTAGEESDLFDEGREETVSVSGRTPTAGRRLPPSPAPGTAPGTQPASAPRPLRTSSASATPDGAAQPAGGVSARGTTTPNTPAAAPSSTTT